MRTTRPHPGWLPATALVVGATLLAPAAGAALTTDRARHPADGAGAELRRPLLRHRPGVLDLVARTIGIERADLVRDLRQGRSIAEIARTRGTDPDTVVDALVATASKRIDEAVTRGRLDADRADHLKAKLPERVRKLVEREPGRRDARHRPRGLRVARRALGVVARTIGIERADLVRELRQGRSIAEIARTRGTDPDTVVDALVATASKRIDEAVTRGRLDADRADHLKAKLPERARKLVEREPRAGRLRAERDR